MAQLITKVKFFILAFLLVANLPLHAQTERPYFQQRVDYNINVTLDDNKHVLQGVISINYVNNSPDPLSTLVFHLWPNAYKNTGTAFAKQKLENGDTEFHYSKEEDRGYIDGLKFTVNNIPIEHRLDSVNIDIAYLDLQRTLQPGDSVTIVTPFLVKIPKSVSRLGHVGKSYQITQWYPKPAVYDRDGWHPMPYLDQGEFYSEFGNFEVSITLPANYVVAASGDLQDQAEINWLTEKAAMTAKAATPMPVKRKPVFPASDNTQKTLHYKLQNAHDFAWFADPRYYVSKDSLVLERTGRTVTTWTMYTDTDWDLWKKSNQYLQNAIKHYSNYLADYPYNTATAVEGALSAGAGMEYPTITIIGSSTDDRSLETVIVHEVGHFWLYGSLGTNERIYPWMDEGINSFYENRYFEDFHPGAKWLQRPKFVAKAFDLEDYERNYVSQLMYLFTATKNQSQALGLPADEYTSTNYGTVVYGKGALAMQHLRGYLGDSIFDMAMLEYAQRWQFKHPSPNDLRKILERNSGKDLSWFFDELLSTSVPVDYAITKVKKPKDYDHFVYVSVKNRTGVATPFSITGMRKGEAIRTVWYDGTGTDTTVHFPAGDFDMYRLDGEEDMVEYNRSNNSYRKNGMLHKAEPVKFQFLGSLDHPYKNQLFLSPFVGWNNYDKTIVGFAFYNHSLPFKKLEFELVPTFGTASGAITGTSRIYYNYMPHRGKLERVRFGVTGKRFSYLLNPEPLQWNKIEPQVLLELKPKTPRSPIRLSLNLRSANIIQQYLFGGETKSIHYYVNEARFTFANKRRLHPFNASVQMQQGELFMNISAKASFRIHYMKAKEHVDINIFVGGFLYNNKAANDIRPPHPVFQLSGTTGGGNEKLLMFQDDYMFDHHFLDRNGFDPYLSHQVVTKDGGFRSMTNIGDTKKFLATVTTDVTMPGPIPISLFAGFGAYVFTSNGEDKIEPVAELGISVVVIEDVLEFNMPLVTTKNIKQNQETALGLDKFYEKFTFTLNLAKVDPFKTIRNFKF